MLSGQPITTSTRQPSVSFATGTSVPVMAAPLTVMDFTPRWTPLGLATLMEIFLPRNWRVAL
jgi:hypothetical protein